MKVRKKDLDIIKIQDDTLETSIREHTKASQRVKRESTYIKHRKKFMLCALTSLLVTIFLAIGCCYVIIHNYDACSVSEIKKVTIIMYLGSLVIWGMPYFPVHLVIFKESMTGKRMFSWRYCKKFFRKTDKVVDLCHHCSNMMLISQTNVQLEYFTGKSQVFARKALLKILKLTNICIRDKYYQALNFKHRKQFIKTVNDYLKELNGALIMTYKGNVPKYVTDAFEQIGLNIIELRKKEVRL